MLPTRKDGHDFSRAAKATETVRLQPLRAHLQGWAAMPRADFRTLGIGPIKHANVAFARSAKGEVQTTSSIVAKPKPRTLAR